MWRQRNRSGPAILQRRHWQNDHPNAGNPITNAKEFLEATSGERNEYLMAHFAKVFPQAHIDKIVCVLNDGDEKFYDLYTDGMKSAVTVIIEHGELDIVSTLELVMNSKNTTYEEMLEKHNSKKNKIALTSSLPQSS